MGFGEAVSSAFRQYANFSGRAQRSEYWWYTLFAGLCYVVGLVIDAAANSIVILILIMLALFLPSLAVSVRRLHDTNRSGAWVLIGLVPLVGGIILLVYQCEEGTPGPNGYGPPPARSVGHPASAEPWDAGQTRLRSTAGDVLQPPRPLSAGPQPPNGQSRRCERAHCPRFHRAVPDARCAACGAATQAFTPSSTDGPDEPRLDVPSAVGRDMQPGPPTTPAQWTPDPYRRYELRYFDGTAWTEYVSTRGVHTVDSAQP